MKMAASSSITASPPQTNSTDLNLNVGAGDSSIPLSATSTANNNNNNNNDSNDAFDHPGKELNMIDGKSPRVGQNQNQNQHSGTIPLVLRSKTGKKGKGSEGVLDNRALTCAQSFIHKSLYISLTILILAQATLLGGWIHLYDLINSTMPRTFAWRALLSPFGTIFEYTQCFTDPAQILRYPRTSCPIQNSSPAVPIIGIVISAVQLTLGVFFMCFQKCRKSFVFYMKQLLFLEGLFVLFGVVVSVSLIFRDLDLLKESMSEELTASEQFWRNETSRWKITQTLHECCGLTSFSDWKKIPKSCCESPPCTEKTAWKKGCYAIEYRQTVLYGKIEISMLISIFLMGLAFFFFSRRFLSSCREYDSIKEISNHRIFMRQGSNFITFGGQGGNNHVIRKDGIMIDAKGALASSTGVNDSHISLETLNFSPHDQINVTRESDRIVITVTRGNVTRGMAVITASDGQDLEKIIITPTPNGLLNIFG